LSPARGPHAFVLSKFCLPRISSTFIMSPRTRQRSPPAQFELAAWCKEAALTTSTRKILKDNAITDVRTLLLISAQDISALQLPMGQTLLLKAALERLGNVKMDDASSPALGDDGLSTPSRSAQPSAPDLLAAGKTLDSLLANMSTDNQPAGPAPAHHDLPDYDPRVHLTLRASAKKALRIFHFLPDKIKERIQRSRRDRYLLTQTDDGGITMQARDPESFIISQAEWNAANARIMARLIQSGDLPIQDVDLYLAYTVQINEMCEIYDWSSILTFDGRYRELQAQHGFPWGDLRMAAHSTILVPRHTHHTAAPPKRRQDRTGPAHTQSGARYEDCKKWLASGGKFCPFGGNCRYAHRQVDAQGHQSEYHVPKNGHSQTPQAAGL